MDFLQFHAALGTLLALDMQDLADAGAIKDSDYAAWEEFHRDPCRWILGASDESAAAVWKAMWRRRALDRMIEQRRRRPSNVVQFDSKRSRNS